MERFLILVEDLCSEEHFDFEKYDELCLIISKLTTKKEDLISSLNRISPKLFEIGNVQKLINSLVEMFELNQTLAGDLYKEIINKQEKVLYYLIPGFIKGFYNRFGFEIFEEKLHFLLESADDELIMQGYLSVIDVEILPGDNYVRNLNYINKKVDIHISSVVDLATLRVIVRILFNFKNEIIDFSDKLLSISSNKKEETQIEILWGLWNTLKIDSDFDIYKSLLMQFVDATDSRNSMLNRVLVNLLSNHLNLVVEFLNNWIILNKQNLSKHVFDDLLLEFYRSNNVGFRDLITNWLNSDNPNFHIACFHTCRLLSHHSCQNLEISEELIKQYNINDIEYMSFKILGYVYDKDLSYTLLFSILKNKIDDNDVVDLISEIFINHLIYNFYSVYERLEKQKTSSNKKEKNVIDNILNASKAYYDNIYKLPLIKEFSPSEERLNSFNKLQSRNFQKSFKESEEKRGGFSSLFTTVNYRTGKSTFTKYMNKYSEKFEPSLISHSMEMPRGEYIDPIGEEKQRLIWQNRKREK